MHGELKENIYMQHRTVYDEGSSSSACKLNFDISAGRHHKLGINDSTPACHWLCSAVGRDVLGLSTSVDESVL